MLFRKKKSLKRKVTTVFVALLCFRYVVIGGGKTGLDTVLYINRHMRQGVDEVMLVTGRSKLFLRRDTVFPPFENMQRGEFSPFTLGEVKLDLTLGWDGTNEEVVVAAAAV